MRPLWKDILAALWLGILIPGIVLHGLVLKERHRQIRSVAAEAVVAPAEPSVRVRDSEDLHTYMPLSTYLTGVVLAEMPADFHPEALKAQAVAARTYTWKAVKTGGKHGDNSICTDSACCQAYISEEDYLSRGGIRENLDKVREAVDSTGRLVLSYNGELIEATYFSSCDGSTEAALTVWGTDYPYLQAVASPETETKVVNITFSPEEFQNLLGKSLGDDPMQWFGDVSYTEGGGVAEIQINGESYTGVQLRSDLGLPSTAFQIEADGGRITITSRGYGHRVGMSQYGANALAENGHTWQQILQHYYPGTTLHPVRET